MPTYKHQWFNQCIAPIWERYIVPRKAGIHSYLEIGVCEGQSLIWALQNILPPKGCAIGVDPFLPARHWRQQEADEHKAAAISNITEHYNHDALQVSGYHFAWSKENSPHCSLYTLTSEKYLIGYAAHHECLDLAYVDGDHNAGTALLDMALCWRLLRPGGMMVVDDIDRAWRQGRPLVAEAIQAFEIAFDTRFDVLFRHVRQVCYIKRGATGRNWHPPMMVQADPIPPRT